VSHPKDAPPDHSQLASVGQTSASKSIPEPASVCTTSATFGVCEPAPVADTGATEQIRVGTPVRYTDARWNQSGARNRPLDRKSTMHPMVRCAHSSTVCSASSCLWGMADRLVDAILSKRPHSNTKENHANSVNHYHPWTVLCPVERRPTGRYRQTDRPIRER
jgi:hypothetical protein